MSYLADTNVASRRVLPADPQYAAIVTAMNHLHSHGEIIHITAQVLIEFHALATRPAVANGLGFSAAKAGAEARKLAAIFPLLPDTADIYPIWRRLVERYGIVGRQVYDARLVAVMLAHGTTHILTTNANHFRRFAEVTVVAPADVRS